MRAAIVLALVFAMASPAFGGSTRQRTQNKAAADRSKAVKKAKYQRKEAAVAANMARARGEKPPTQTRGGSSLSNEQKQVIGAIVVGAAIGLALSQSDTADSYNDISESERFLQRRRQREDYLDQARRAADAGNVEEARRLRSLAN
jgi:hypothetical protein